MSLATLSKMMGDVSVGDLVAKYGQMENGIEQLKIDAQARRIPEDRAMMAKMAIERIAQKAITPNKMSIYQEQMAPTPPQMAPQAGLAAVPMAGGGMVAFRNGGSIPRFQMGGLNRFVTEYDPMGLDDPSSLTPLPGETQQEFIERMRRRAAGIAEVRQSILGPDVGAQKERERLEARKAALGKEAEQDKWLTGLETAFRMLQTGRVGEEAARGLGQYRAGKQRFMAAEEDVQKGLAAVSGRERAEKASALDAALAQEMKLEQTREAGKSQLEIALANAAKTSNQREYAQLFADTVANTPAGQGKTREQLLLEGSQDYIRRSTAYDPRMTSALAAAYQAQTTGAKESRIPVSEAIEAWNKLSVTDPAKRAYRKLSSEADRLDSANNPQAANSKRMEAERIKEEWLKSASRRELGSSPAQSAPPPPTGFVPQKL